MTYRLIMTHMLTIYGEWLILGYSTALGLVGLIGVIEPVHIGSYYTNTGYKNRRFLLTK